MEKSKEMQRRAARAMKRAMRQGIDPRNSTETQGKVYRRLCVEDFLRKPLITPMGIDANGKELHVHKFDWDGNQQCECGAKFF